MMRKYYLGLNTDGPKVLKCLFTHGNSQDLRDLSSYLAKKYQGTAMLAKNGRSALTLALKSYFDPGDKIIVNGFTCYAVYEAVTKARMTPIFADITKENLNFSIETLEKLLKDPTLHPKGIIVQNTLGNPVDIVEIEKFADKHNLVIIEDLAHLAGAKYPDGREVGTVGAAVAFSFGKDKSINTISGGALVLRAPVRRDIETPYRVPRISDHLKARFYPFFCACARGLNYIHLGGVLMRCLIKIHWVEKSADNKLSLSRRCSKFQAKMALEQLKKHTSKGVLREHYLVRDRAEVLDKLRNAGYYFDSFWYEKPVSPERYYREVGFPEETCPVAVEVASTIINLPTYYDKDDLKKAREIIGPYLIDGDLDGKRLDGDLSSKNEPKKVANTKGSKNE